MFGLVLGSLVSVTVFPCIHQNLQLQSADQGNCFESDCNLKSPILNSPINVRNSPSMAAIAAKLRDEPLEAVIHRPITPPADSNKKTPPKLVRPRFFATEVDMRDKLLVVVLVTQDNFNFAAALNMTTAHHVSKMLFFVDASIQVELF